jgi:hypothetical protein
MPKILERGRKAMTVEYKKTLEEISEMLNRARGCL